MNSQVVTLSVQTTDTAVLPPNPKRTYLTIYNLGANNVFLTFGGTAVASVGELLLSAQRPLKLSLETHGMRLKENLRGIAATGATPITIVECFD